jgi:hypothetical protein
LEVSAAVREPKTTVGKWWWEDGHIAGHFNDPDESPDGLTLRPDCPRCVGLSVAMLGERE